MKYHFILSYSRDQSEAKENNMAEQMELCICVLTAWYLLLYMTGQGSLFLKNISYICVIVGDKLDHVLS